MNIKSILQITALLASVSLLGGCGLIPHDVTINPQLNIVPGDIGGGKTLQVRVLDDRSQQSIGHRTYAKTGKITVNQQQNLVSDIKTAIEGGFETLNFKIVDKNASREAKVDIRLIGYDGLFGLFTVGSLSRATFKVTCTNGAGNKLENIYRVEVEHRSIVVPTKEYNRKWINGVVSDAIMRLFYDRDMLEFLASDD